MTLSEKRQAVRVFFMSEGIRFYFANTIKDGYAFREHTGFLDNKRAAEQRASQLRTFGKRCPVPVVVRVTMSHTVEGFRNYNTTVRIFNDL